jgi:hypothetical protein
MMLAANPWTPEARALGFQSEESMLRNLYEEQRLSLSKIARMLKHSVCAVSMRLRSYNVALRSRGGPNGKGKRALKDVPNSVLFHSPPPKIAETYSVCIATVFLEKRRRRKDALLPNYANKNEPSVRK